ncbi:hypothetical protein GCM10018980_13760 [Streptomyces capoamus]|uniref:Uncharacterized protein n=1 Tax=Streptomyces capoamus TaxID=68183 RepID=A0A919C2W3_9ACTN|nr:hypothetical protein GCM10010501_20720 [Streptomyces libani subsp. rufus]GHG39915.1 hypothetical protein GCM10018980_13760 [Streptomyces capoamus]
MTTVRGSGMPRSFRRPAHVRNDWVLSHPAIAPTAGARCPAGRPSSSRGLGRARRIARAAVPAPAVAGVRGDAVPSWTKRPRGLAWSGGGGGVTVLLSPGGADCSAHCPQEVPMSSKRRRKKKGRRKHAANHGRRPQC